VQIQERERSWFTAGRTRRRRVKEQPAPDSDPIDVAHDRKRWSGTLANSDDYYINVGAARSVATYTLTIKVK